MQYPAFFFLLWLLIATGSFQIDLSSSPIDLFHDDSQLFTSEPQLQDADSLDQSLGLDSDLFSDNYQLLSPGEPDPSSVFTDTDLDQFAQSDPSYLTAGDPACDSSDATYPQLFGKNRRREDSCKIPPAGEAGRYRKDDHLPDMGFTNFATTRRTMMVFPRNYEICPYEKFSGANIPVCKEASPQDILKVAGVPWYNLRNVVPFYFNGFQRMCFGLNLGAGELWCCQILQFRTKKPVDVAPLDDNIIGFLQMLDIQDFNRLMSVRLNVYDASICYQQDRT